MKRKDPMPPLAALGIALGLAGCASHPPVPAGPAPASEAVAGEGHAATVRCVNTAQRWRSRLDEAPACPDPGLRRYERDELWRTGATDPGAALERLDPRIRLLR